MHFRRLSALALGAWLAGSLVVSTFTAENRRNVEMLVRRPAREAVDVVAKLQESELRALLSYQASEINRVVTNYWEIAQLVLGAAVLAGFFFSPTGSRYPALMCVLMLLTVVFLHWFLSPQIASLSRTAIFASGQTPVAQDRLRSLQTGYATAEYLKLAIGVVTAWALLKRARRSRHHHHSSSVPEAE